METIDTMVRNWGTLSNAHIDWSLNGGVVWLLAMVVMGLAGAGTVAWLEARQARRVARQALYRRAEASLQVRQRIMDQDGFIERYG